MKIKNIIIIVIIVGALAALKIIFFPSQSDQTKGAKQGKAPAATVSVYVIKPEKLENTLNASGTILANEEELLKPEIAGKIISLPLQEGTEVTKNQLLVKINDADFQAQLKKLQLQYDLADKNLKREEELLKINGISQSDFDAAQNAASTIKADMDYQQSLIAKTEIHAPFNGVVGLKSVSEGAFVSIGASIATVLQIDPVKIDFTVSERYAPFIQKGIKVIFTIDGMKGDVEGEIYAVEPKIDMSTRTFMVRAICPNKDKKIFAGSFANIKVLLKDISDAIMIPTESVIPELRGKKVFVIKSGKAMSVPIETGIRTSSKIQVLSGLELGDTVVTSGIMSLKPDVPVSITQVK